MAMEAEISLRPMALRPGGASAKVNPFAGFRQGAGAGIHKKVDGEDTVGVPERKRKPPSEVIRYTKEFLLQFNERCTKCPSEIAAITDILLDPNDTDAADTQKEVVQRLQPEVATDDRDWRARTSLPPLPLDAQPASTEQGARQQNNNTQQANSTSSSNTANQQQQQQWQRGTTAPSGGAKSAATPGPAPKIVKATDLGLKAWMPGSAAHGNERSIKAVKGILNKLTPEKFDRLLGQLLETVTNADILHATITLVFENAVVQPTFVAMYADLCQRLSQELPEFAPPEGETKPMSFKRVLLNTCQEEFEGATQAREALETMAEEDVAAAAKTAKQRTLGNIRLIGELYKKGVVNEKIVHVCVQDLMRPVRSGKKEPHDDNIEAVCELMTIAGKTLESSPAGKPRLEEYFAALKKLSVNKTLPSRIRFMLRDVLDLRHSHWVPRRETLKAKKISEVQAEAYAELGMVPTQALPQLQALPALPGLPKPEADFELFPALRGRNDGWETVGPKGKNSSKGAGYSAFLGEYKPIATAPAPAPARAAPAGPQRAQPPPQKVPNAPPPEAPGTAAAPARPALTKLTDEERESRAKSLFGEYLASRDMVEALACVRELDAPGFMPKLVAIGIDKLLECIKDVEHDMLIDLLVSLRKRNAYSEDDLLAGLQQYADTLEDMSLDVPKLPVLLGKLVGQAFAEGVLPVAKTEELCKPVESAEPRREFAANVLRQLKVKAGEKRMVELWKESGLDATSLLAADPEFDPPDLPDVPAFLKSKGLDAIPT